MLRSILWCNGRSIIALAITGVPFLTAQLHRKSDCSGHRDGKNEKHLNNSIPEIRRFRGPPCKIGEQH